MRRAWRPVRRPSRGCVPAAHLDIFALLGSRDEVEYVLDAAESTPLPDSSDGSPPRPAYAGTSPQPAHVAQIADLLAARNQVRVIAGTEALTVARCARVLRDENTHAVYGTRSIRIKEATAANLDSACHSAAMTAGHSVVLVDLRTATPPPRQKRGPKPVMPSPPGWAEPSASS